MSPKVGETVGCVSNRLDPDETPSSVSSGSRPFACGAVVMDMWALLQRRQAGERRAQTARPPREFKVTKYMHNPPIIMPNYGKRKSSQLGQPKTNISRVLLYDNITQQQMLDIKLAHIKIEKDRQGRLMDLHKKSFSIKMSNRFRHLRAISNSNSSSKLPEIERNTTRSITKVTDRTDTFSLEDVKLPRVKKPDHDKEIIFRVKSKSGRKHVYYSYDDSGIFANFVPLFSFYDKVHDDPRFQQLESRLITAPDESTFDGFAVLSPSYDANLPTVPTFLRNPDSKPGSCKRP